MWSAGKVDRFFDDCYDELMRRQDALEEDYGIGSWARFDMDLEEGVLSFSGAGKSLRFRVLPIGSFSLGDEVWQWAWSNRQIPEASRNQLAPVRNLGREIGLDVITEPRWSGDEQVAWDMCGIALHRLGGLGVYRVTGSEVFIYLLLRSVMEDV